MLLVVGCHSTGSKCGTFTSPSRRPSFAGSPCGWDARTMAKVPPSWRPRAITHTLTPICVSVVDLTPRWLRTQTLPSEARPRTLGPRAKCRQLARRLVRIHVRGVTRFVGGPYTRIPPTVVERRDEQLAADSRKCSRMDGGESQGW